jgi:hypothetical protein
MIWSTSQVGKSDFVCAGYNFVHRTFCLSNIVEEARFSFKDVVYKTTVHKEKLSFFYYPTGSKNLKTVFKGLKFLENIILSRITFFKSDQKMSTNVKLGE